MIRAKSRALIFYSKAQHVLTLLSPQNPKPPITNSHVHTEDFCQRVRPLSTAAEAGDRSENGTAEWIQNVMKFRRDKSPEDIGKALDLAVGAVSEKLLREVLRRHRSDWRPALTFFNWALKPHAGEELSPGLKSYNELIDILGKMNRFEEARQVLDNMLQREIPPDKVTYTILLNRLAAANKVDEAIEIFRRRQEFGLESDSDAWAFQTLMVWLCRYKHVEDAETFFHKNRAKFGSEIKAWNIILNGWCIRGNAHEAKRVWKDILESKTRPDIFTFGTFINALTKKGKLGSALNLFEFMRRNRCEPDVIICNNMINALCFKNRIPEALELLRSMPERGCEPTTATYNTLIKYMIKIGRTEKVYEIVEEMEREGEKGKKISPNRVTFGFLLGSVGRAEEVPGLLKRMEKNGVRMNGDMYNLVMRLYLDWDREERAIEMWSQMESRGFGPDERSYTIMIHWLKDKGRNEDAARYYKLMTSKGMKPEPRTDILMGMPRSTQTRNKVRRRSGKPMRKR